MREIVARHLSKSVDLADYKRWFSVMEEVAAGLSTDQPDVRDVPETGLPGASLEGGDFLYSGR